MVSRPEFINERSSIVMPSKNAATQIHQANDAALDQRGTNPLREF